MSLNTLSEEQKSDLATSLALAYLGAHSEIVVNTIPDEPHVHMQNFAMKFFEVHGVMMNFLNTIHFAD
jgi:hypothetical protein|nr:hypothetical protein [Acutalibacter muris]